MNALRRRWPLLLLSAALVAACVRCAWLADDAFITFRVSDNLIHGFGPRWNTFERVQAYTNPLWMLVVAACTAVTSELVVTVAAVQLALTLAVALALARGARAAASGALALAVLGLSRAFVDFSAAGLENALAHLLLVLFAYASLRGGRFFERALFASLALTTRLDLAWLLAPSLLELAARAPRSARRSLALGALPVVLWEAFAFFYYGSFVPNSARAKLGTGVPEPRLLARGGAYLLDSLRVDPLTLAAIAGAVLLALSRRGRRERALAIGVALAIAYVAFVGGDFMSGRFLTAPLAVAAVLLSRARLPKRAIAGAAAGAVALAAAVGLPTVTDRFQRAPDASRAVVDCRLAFHPFTGLTVGHFPPWYLEYGPRLRESPTPTVQPAVGIAGYYAGPAVRIVDAFALADPLRARLPIPDPRNEAFLKMGHLMRPVPDGYLATVGGGENRLVDPGLRAYWDAVAFVTQGSLWSGRRLAAAAKLELGLYDELLGGYLATYDEKPVRLEQLGRARPADPRCYSFFSACAERGVAFTETGARVEIAPARAGRVAFEATPDDYDVIFRRLGREVARARAPAGETAVGAVAAGEFDAVALLPRTGRGRRAITAFSIEP